MNSHSRLACLPLLAAFSLAHAQQGAQTDWSEGNDPATVLAWNESFDSTTDASWRSIQGQLALSSAWSALTTQEFATKNLPFAIHAADIDGDGDQDVVGTSEGDNEVLFWENDGGNPPAWTEHAIDANQPDPNALITADFDLDGRIDVAISAIGSVNDLIWYRNEGGSPPTWTRSVIDANWNTCFELAVGDVNQDGRPDLLATSMNLQSIAWFENVPGSPMTFKKHVIHNTFNGAHCVKTADIDGDGDMDIVATAAVADRIAWWSNEGGTPIQWNGHVIRNNWDGGRSLEIADIDDDGDLDVISVSWNSHVSIFKNSGTLNPTWTEEVVSSNFNGGHHVRVADITGNGRLDILAAAFIDKDVICFENGGGNPIVWTKRIVTPSFPMPTEVDVADLNGDGSLDVLAASWRSSGKFRWWTTTEFMTSGDLTSNVLDTVTGMPTAKIEWDATTPAGTSLGFQVRSGPDAASLGAWSAELDAEAIVGDLARFVQYRVLMSTTDGGVSPLVRSVSLATPSVTNRNGAGTNPNVFTTDTLPLLGQNWIGEVDGSTLGATGSSFLLGYPASLDPGRQFGVGELLLDVASGRIFLDAVALAAGVGTHTLLVPNDAMLVGLSLSTQAYLPNAPAQGRLTNALDLVIGQ